jgi:hypothetical protein
MVQFVDDPQVPIDYDPRFREYSLLLRGSGGLQLIRHCPWCGARLPDSLRDLFFDEMDRLGLDYPDDEPPGAYLTDAWWRQADEQ